MRQLNPIASSSRSSIALAAAGALGLFLSTATARADIAPPQIIRIGKPTPAPQKVPVATPNTNAPRAEPNMWQLAGGGMEVSFASTGIDGKARLTVTTKELGARSFTGDQIRITPSEIGTLVTVTIAAIPDLSTTTLTLILPGASVEMGASLAVKVVSLTTVQRTSIGGPNLVRGQRQTQTAVTLEGTARVVVF